MNYNPNERTRRAASTEPKSSAEAQLFAEILARMDSAKQGGGKPQPNAGSSGNAAKTIDLVELFYFVLSKLHYIILGAVIGALLLGFYASSRMVPIYTATSKLYIMGQTENNLIADLQIGTVLTMDYQEVFKTWEVHQMVNEQLGTNYSYSQLQSMLSVENPEDTRILYITVRHPDPQASADIANAYATAAQQFITKTMDTDEPSTFSIALVPSVAVTKSVTSWVIRGILLGTVLAGGILVLLFILDNRPKSPEDIMQCAGIPTLAVIPVNSNKSKHGQRRER